MEKQQTQAQFIYPIPFQDFLDFRKRQKEGAVAYFNIQEMGKLRKLKKLLEMTQEKICNRIRLFKKVSVQIRKRKQKQNHHHQQRSQNVKKRTPAQNSGKNNQGLGYMRSTKSSAGLLRVRQISELDRPEPAQKKAQLLLQQRHQHAQEIKIWKQRNKKIVEQRRVKQMREKVQSANMIRSNRHKVKEVRIQWEQERLEQARRMKEQKFKEEVEKYDELQFNLTRLQKEERDALIMWKQAMESP